MTNDPNDDELVSRIRGAIPGLTGGTRDLDRIKAGIRRRKQVRWSGATALVTAAIVAVAVITTSGGGDHRDSIIPPATEAPATVAPVPAASSASSPTAPVSSPAAPPTHSANPGPADGADDLYAVTLHGSVALLSGRTGALVRIVVPKAAADHDYSYPVIGPSGRFVYYIEAATAPSGSPASWRIMRVPVVGGQPTVLPITPPRSISPQYRGLMVAPDDAHLILTAYASNPSELYEFSTAGGSVRTFAVHDPSGMQSAQVAGWLSDNHEVVIQGTTSTHTIISRFDLDAGTSTPVATLPLIFGSCRVVDVSRSGQAAVLGGGAPANCTSPLPVTYVDTATGAITRGPLLPASFTATNISAFEFVASGALVADSCGQPTVRISGGRVTTLGSTGSTC